MEVIDPDWLQRELSATPLIMWRVSNSRSPERKPIRWLPISHLSLGKYAEGLSESGEWVVDSADGVVTAKPEKHVTFLLPILDREPEVVRKELALALQRCGLADTLVRTFPFERIMLEAIAGIECYSERALAWLEKWDFSSIDLPIFISALQDLCVDKRRASQKTRQRAKRLIKAVDEYREPNS